MTQWRKIHRRKNEDLLFAEDLGGFGCAPRDLEIIDSGVRVVSDGDTKKEMPWLAFKGAKKVLALNVTNCKIMTTLSGTGEIEKWRGPITLIVVRTKYQDRLTGQRMETDAIRIAPERPRVASRGAKEERKSDAAPAEKSVPRPTDEDGDEFPPMTADEIAEIARREREEAARG